MDIAGRRDELIVKEALASSKYPDITAGPALKQILVILKASWKELDNDQLTAEEISDLLWKCAKINMDARRVSSILNAAWEKARTIKRDGKVYYSITDKGDSHLGARPVVDMITPELFDKGLMAQLGPRFREELSQAEVSYKYGSGDALAFLLRKILEKAIYLSFAKTGKMARITDPATSRYFGLEKLIDICAVETGTDGTPFLIPKTAKELKGIKFLGDSAAHDFLNNVRVSDIKPELPVFKVSLGQLAKKL